MRPAFNSLSNRFGLVVEIVMAYIFEDDAGEPGTVKSKLIGAEK
jgi:hypothetical protein